MHTNLEVLKGLQTKSCVVVVVELVDSRRSEPYNTKAPQFELRQLEKSPLIQKTNLRQCIKTVYGNISSFMCKNMFVMYIMHTFHVATNDFPVHAVFRSSSIVPATASICVCAAELMFKKISFCSVHHKIKSFQFKHSSKHFVVKISQEHQKFTGKLCLSIASNYKSNTLFFPVQSIFYSIVELVKNS